MSWGQMVVFSLSSRRDAQLFYFRIRRRRRHLPSCRPAGSMLVSIRPPDLNQSNPFTFTLKYGESRLYSPRYHRPRSGLPVRASIESHLPPTDSSQAEVGLPGRPCGDHNLSIISWFHVPDEQSQLAMSDQTAESH